MEDVLSTLERPPIKLDSDTYIIWVLRLGTRRWDGEYGQGVTAVYNGCSALDRYHILTYTLAVEYRDDTGFDIF